MTAIIVALVSFVGIISFVMWATHGLRPIPLLSRKQGERDMEGVVTQIKEIRPGIYEVGLTQKIEPGPTKNLPKGIFKISSGSMTSFIHFRGKENLPAIDMIIQAKTVNRWYVFIRKSFNWTSSWKIIEKASVVGTMKVVNF